MKICPKCLTYSVASDNRCLNCRGTVTYKVAKRSYGFLDFVKDVALFVSIAIIGLTIAVIVYVKFLEGVV